jgi:hypothetical protein
MDPEQTPSRHRSRAMLDYAVPIDDETAEKLMIQPAIGSGTSREVFAVDGDENLVIKKIKTDYHGPNMIEWIVWCAIRDTPISTLFGKCIQISKTGRYLLMERLGNLIQSEIADIPKIPSWVNDRKLDAFGKSESGVIKLRDYGMINFADLLSNPALEPPGIQINANMKRLQRVEGW